MLLMVLLFFGAWLIVSHWRLLRSRQELQLAQSNMVKRLVVSDVVKRLGEVICSHCLDANLLKLYIAIVDSALDVVVCKELG
jgi:hypothetical protein